MMVGDIHAGIHEVGEVERLKGVKLLSTLFGRTIAAKQMAAEADAYLWHQRMALAVFGSSNLHRCDQILLTVCAQLAYRQLRACEDDRLRQVLEHVGEGRGGIGHRVGAMKHDKTVVVAIVVGYAVGDVCPSGWRHVAGVDGWGELESVNLSIKLLQFRHMQKQVLEVKGLQRSRLRIAVHADGTACVYQ